jgi:hypothetical protein
MFADDVHAAARLAPVSEFKPATVRHACHPYVLKRHHAANDALWRCRVVTLRHLCTSSAPTNSSLATTLFLRCAKPSLSGESAMRLFAKSWCTSCGFTLLTAFISVFLPS